MHHKRAAAEAPVKEAAGTVADIATCHKGPDMEPDLKVCRECHAARGCPRDLDFDVELPMGWSSCMGASALDDTAPMSVLWQACSADALLHLQVRACVGTLAQPGLQVALDRWCPGEDLRAAEPPSAVPALARHEAVQGLARQGAGARAGTEADAPWVWVAYVQHRSLVLELRLDSPASQAGIAQRVWQCVAASWHLRAAAPARATPKRAGPDRAAWWSSALSLMAQGQIDQALQRIQAEDLQANGLLAQAELLSLHMRNALAAGHLSDALRAQQRAAAIKQDYARSPGGGMAGLLRMDERDRFLAQLRRMSTGAPAP